MAPPLAVRFVGGEHGTWRVERLVAVTGEALDDVPRLALIEGAHAASPGGVWTLRGVTSNERYVEPVSYTHLTLPTICSV